MCVRTYAEGKVRLCDDRRWKCVYELTREAGRKITRSENVRFNDLIDRQQRLHRAKDKRKIGVIVLYAVRHSRHTWNSHKIVAVKFFCVYVPTFSCLIHLKLQKTMEMGFAVRHVAHKNVYSSKLPLHFYNSSAVTYDIDVLKFYTHRIAYVLFICIFGWTIWPNNLNSSYARATLNTLNIISCKSVKEPYDKTCTHTLNDQWSYACQLWPVVDSLESYSYIFYAIYVDSWILNAHAFVNQCEVKGKA